MRVNRFCYISIYLTIFLCILLGFQIASADEYMDEEKQFLIQAIQSQIYNDNFASAQSIAESLQVRNPADPLGDLFLAGAYLSEMTDSEDELYTEIFKFLIDTAIVKAEAQLTDEDFSKTAWMYLIIGHAHAYRSLFESKFGSFTQTLKQGLAAKNAYHDGLEYDETLYDLYGGLGMYHYWKSAKAGILRWIRVFNNDMDKGIDELYLTIDSSLISADVARAALVWIYIDKKEYLKAIAIAEYLYEKYPEGKTFLWAIGEAHYKDENYIEAIKVYNLLREKVSMNPGNYFNLVELDYLLYKSYKSAGIKAKAESSAIKIMEYVNNIPENIRKKQKDKINELVKKGSKY